MTKGDRVTIPGVYTTVENNDNVVMDNVNAIMSVVGGIAGQPMFDFNHFVVVGREVAKHYGLLDVEKRINKFEDEYEGRQVTIQTFILFWIAVFGVNKDECNHPSSEKIIGIISLEPICNQCIRERTE